ncbi:hypothetical protein V6N12_036202 [Hibiscus sabdariffa]|uniref:DUF4283 domain-containing protein n=1 Tax=Hibiscus sabdariffa TaxID=183260 RepID=A0ABR2EPX8_9ROSI
MLNSWFISIDSYDSFISSKKLKIWVNLEGFPIDAWHESIFISITSKWGSFVKLDEDTACKNRFDIAKVLVSVSLISDIPQQVDISVNGVVHSVKVTTMEFEDDRCWIDHDQAKSQFVNFNNRHGFSGDGDSPMSWAEMSISKVQEGDAIQVGQARPKCMALLARSTSAKKARGIPIISNQKTVPSFHQSDMVSNSIPKDMTGPVGLPVVGSRDAPSTSSQQQKYMHNSNLVAEAKETLEVCKNLGLHFEAPDENVVNRHVEIEVESHISL